MIIFPFSLILAITANFSTVASREVSDKNAVVTLVTGPKSAYTSGAIALGQSLIDVGSKLRRVVMVTPDVDKVSRDSMKKLWEVVEVQPIACNHQSNLDPTQFDLEGAQYKAGIKRWSSTCTKFAAFSLIQFERVIFLDCDMLVVSPIDDAIYSFSNASFLAAPETFPPDNFNSGFLVLNPGKANFDNMMRLNKEVGSAEGGDQGVFNNGLCPQWHYVGPEDPNCGRLPWIFNVEAAHYDKYSTLRKMSKLRSPAVIHFVGDGKPWNVLFMEYSQNGFDNHPESFVITLGRQAAAHLLWRAAFFRATGETPSNNRVLLEAASKAAEGSSKSPKGSQKASIEKSKKPFLNKNKNKNKKMKIVKGKSKDKKDRKGSGSGHDGATAARRKKRIHLKKSSQKSKKSSSSTPTPKKSNKGGRGRRINKLKIRTKAGTVKTEGTEEL